MSSVDGETKTFLVHDVGISEGTVDDAATVVGWAAAIYSGYWYVAAAYAFMDKFFGSSGSSSNKPVEAKLQAILANQDADKLSEIINDLTSNAVTIDNALMATRAYGHSPSAETRVIATNNLTAPTVGLNAVLLSLLEGKVYRFMPEVYASQDWATSAWTHGLFRYGTFYHHYPVYSFGGQSSGSSLTTLHLQLYQQPNKPLDPTWALPAPLQKNHDRWDALLCLPLVLYGLPVWQATLSVLEPFYRLSGRWIEEIDGMSEKMWKFSACWLNSMLWTREMPSASELEADNIFLEPVPEQGWPGLPPKKASAGFHSWPCGVVDPIMGIEIVNPNWWTSDNGKPEMWTVAQAEEFKKQLLLQQVKLKDKNGFAAFLKIITGVSKLRIPPSVSPSLKVHPKLIKVGHPSSGDPSALVAPKYETVIDPGGTAWTAQVKRLTVIVTAPISVQPNPAPAEPHARRAMSDKVFGYAITVTPTGGKQHTFTDWVWPLRVSDADPSLYHKDNGDRRTVPYSIVHKVTDDAKTWETITDGQFRDRRAEGEGKIAFTVTVTVADQEPPRIPEDDFQLSGVAWNLHGAIWVKIEADKQAENQANNGRSFEVTVEVKETAAVDAMGRPNGHSKFSGKFKTYTQQLLMPVDICRVIVPTDYFGWLARLLDNLHVTSKGFGIPIPDPDHDPALELSLWHSVLEKNPALLQRHVHDLRRVTGRARLTPEQALAQINAAAMKVTMNASEALTPAMDSDVELTR